MDKDNNTLILVLAGIIALVIFNGGFSFLGASVAQGGTSQVTRTIRQDSVQVNSQVVVDLSVSVGSENDCPTGDFDVCNDYYVVSEELPQDVEILSVSDEDICDVVPATNRIVCVKLQNAQVKTITYTIKAPSNPQAFTITGYYMFQGDSQVNLISGESSVSVQAIEGCNPDWQCTDWGYWTEGGRSCGTRVRTCNDNSNCGSLAGKPVELETRQCSAEEQLPDAQPNIPPAQVGGNVAIILILLAGYFLFGRKK